MSAPRRPPNDPQPAGAASRSPPWRGAAGARAARAAGLSRREVLKAGAALQLLALLPGGLAGTARAARTVSAGERVLIVVQLTGGNDGLNTVVPFADDLYHRARPVLALPERDLVRLDDRVGLHPALQALRPCWEEGELAIVQGVGCPVPDRSHFRSLEMWHTARTDETPPTAGWLGVLASELQDARTLPVVRVGGRDLPLALAGAASQVPALAALDDLKLRTASGAEARAQRTLLEELCASPEGRQAQAAFLAQASGAAFACAERLAAVRQQTPGRDGPATELAGALRLAAALIAAGLSTRVVYITQEGYDTHARQLKSHALLLRELGEALASFQAQLLRQGDAGRVATLVFSEFGRRIHENASGGTDHGAGAPLLLLGRPIRGGLFGEAPDLSGAVDTDVPVTVDFRRVYASALDWLQVPAERAVPGTHARLPLFA